MKPNKKVSIPFLAFLCLVMIFAKSHSSRAQIDSAGYEIAQLITGFEAEKRQWQQEREGQR